MRNEKRRVTIHKQPEQLFPAAVIPSADGSNHYYMSLLDTRYACTVVMSCSVTSVITNTQILQAPLPC